MLQTIRKLLQEHIAKYIQRTLKTDNKINQQNGKRTRGWTDKEHRK